MTEISTGSRVLPSQARRRLDAYLLRFGDKGLISLEHAEIPRQYPFTPREHSPSLPS